MTHTLQKQPILVENPHTGQTVNVGPLMMYLQQQQGSTLTGQGGAANICQNLKAAYRLISTTPLNVDLHDPERVAAVVNDLFELEDVFAEIASPV